MLLCLHNVQISCSNIINVCGMTFPTIANCSCSVGEMMVGPRTILMMDEISTGLDSSTTFQIIQSIRNLAHLQRATVCVALLQPAPEVFELFDDVMVLAEGKPLSSSKWLPWLAQVIRLGWLERILYQAQMMLRVGLKEVPSFKHDVVSLVPHDE